MSGCTRYLFFPSLIICLILVGCVSTYFKTPNDVYKTPATIYLDDGTEKTGELTIQLESALESGFDNKNLVTIGHKETGNSEEIRIESIKCYKIRNDYYFPKKIDLNLDGNYHLLFVKQLTPEISKIHLYELDQRYRSTSSGKSDELYYISLPNSSKYEAWSIYSNKVSPDFEYKMSNIVSDCPALATKIKSKEKGYYIPHGPRFTFPDSKRLDVFQRIIGEYNNCR
jgi:hypothetical protein